MPRMRGNFNNAIIGPDHTSNKRRSQAPERRVPLKRPWLVGYPCQVLLLTDNSERQLTGYSDINQGIAGSTVLTLLSDAPHSVCMPQLLTTRKYK